MLVVTIISLLFLLVEQIDIVAIFTNNVTSKVTNLTGYSLTYTVTSDITINSAGYINCEVSSRCP